MASWLSGSLSEVVLIYLVIVSLRYFLLVSSERCCCYVWCIFRVSAKCYRS